MTNKYLMKIASTLQDEKDSAKTFGKAWVLGHAGTIAGAAAGGALLASPLGKKLWQSQPVRKAVVNTKLLARNFNRTSIGKTLNFKHKGPAVAAGAVAGGFLGGDVGDYAAIRHGTIQAKKNDQ